MRKRNALKIKFENLTWSLLITMLIVKTIFNIIVIEKIVVVSLLLDPNFFSRLKYNAEALLKVF